MINHRYMLIVSILRAPANATTLIPVISSKNEWEVSEHLKRALGFSLTERSCVFSNLDERTNDTLRSSLVGRLCSIFTKTKVEKEIATFLSGSQRQKIAMLSNSLSTFGGHIPAKVGSLFFLGLKDPAEIGGVFSY